ncbi:MAG: serine hydrolase domain-containing protein [Planctomycetota bacterium]
MTFTGANGAGAEPPRDAGSLGAALENVIEPIIGTQLVGCVVGVQTPSYTFVRGYGGLTPGDASPGGPSPEGPSPAADTIYEIGSITKAFTGTLLADAVLRGEMSLDDPASKWLPEDAGLEVNDTPVSLRHLATHTSGFGPVPANLKPKDSERPFDGYGVDALLASLASFRPPNAPGSYAYSNYAMGTLGVLLERATGKSYDQLLVERITGPLGMRDTTVVVPEAARDRFAPPHIDARLPGHEWNLGQGMRACGAIRSTAADLLKLAAAASNARQGSAPDESPVHAALALATSPHHEGAPVTVGLGWHRAADGVTWWHNGQTGAYASWLSSSAGAPEVGDLSVVVLSNTANPVVTRLGQEVAKAALGLPTESLVSKPSYAVDEATLAKYRGLYLLAPFSYIEVRPGQDRIYARLTGQGTAAVMPTAEHTFEYSIVPAKLVFDVEEDAEHATSLTLFQNGMELVAPRVGDLAE